MRYYFLMIFVLANALAEEEYLSLPTEKPYSITCDFNCYANHGGTDYGAPMRTKVFAAHSGYATSTVSIKSGGYGKYVTVNNENGRISKYAHLDEFSLKLSKEGNKTFLFFCDHSWVNMSSIVNDFNLLKTGFT